MTVLFTIAGLIGSFLCVSMFFLLEQEKVDSKGLPFYGINALGAFLVLISAAHDFDNGDLGTISLELTWVMISLMGMWRAYRRRA